MEGRKRFEDGGPAGNRILLVEDEADVRLLLEHVLLAADYRVDCADTVEAACALLDSRTYELVLADGRLEDGTGMMVAEKAAESGTKALIIHRLCVRPAKRTARALRVPAEAGPPIGAARSGRTRFGSGAILTAR